MDEKTKTRQKELTDLVSGFCGQYLDDEYEELCVKLVEKLGRKREVPFKRGKIENWASGVVYTIGQLNFLFDDSFDPYVTPDDICNHFKTKKSTASNKARDIRKLLNLKLGDDEFSTELVKEYDLSSLGGDLSQVKTLDGAMRTSNLRNLGNIFRSIYSDNSDVGNVRNDKLRELITDIFESEGDYILDSHMKRLHTLLKSSVFISPSCGAGILFVSDTTGGVTVPAFTSMGEYNVEFEGGNIEPVSWHFTRMLGYMQANSKLEGMIINPGIDNFFVSNEMILDILLG